MLRCSLNAPGTIRASHAHSSFIKVFKRAMGRVRASETRQKCQREGAAYRATRSSCSQGAYKRDSFLMRASKAYAYKSDMRSNKATLLRFEGCHACRIARCGLRHQTDLRGLLLPRRT